MRRVDSDSVRAGGSNRLKQIPFFRANLFPPTHQQSKERKKQPTPPLTLFAQTVRSDIPQDKSLREGQRGREREGDSMLILPTSPGRLSFKVGARAWTDLNTLRIVVRIL